MARKKPHEEHENHERYLVTYADLITLLLAFFIILFAMNINENTSKTFDSFAQQFSMGFNSPTRQSLINLQLQDASDQIPKPNQPTPITKEDMQTMKAVKENNDLQQVKQEVEKKIEEKGMQDKITANVQADGLRIVLTDQILFSSGEAMLKPENLDIIHAISMLVLDLPNPINISGHTDNVPVAGPSSNWELSSARSLSVLRYMLSVNPAIDPGRYSAVGYGEFKPIADNNTAEGQAKNRRVEILIKRINEEGLMIPENN